MKPRLFAFASAFVLLTAACGGIGASQTLASRPGQFRLDEWSITADQPKLTSGRRTITAVNLGHQTHELVIVKGTDAASLPKKADGSVDDAQLERLKVGEIADISGGTSRHKVFTLRPGSYVVFCNIVGGMGMGGGMMGGMEHGHFAAGMHTELTVTA